MVGHLLVVDDNPSNLKLACDVLVSAGYEVERARSAEDALASVARAAPALILLDIALPGMDGLSLTRKLKGDEATRAIRVVAMTAYAMKGDEEKMRAAGCDGYIAKPIDTRALPKQIADYLAGNSLRLPRQILIVEDVASHRKLLRVTLESEGFTVFEAADGSEALSILSQVPVEAVISDILMPNMDGYRLCYEIRTSERWFKLPVIIYTNTYTSEGDERVALELGADRYLRKPAPPHVIVDALREAAASSASRTRARIEQPDGLELLKSYSGRLVAKLEDRNLELRNQTQALRESNQLFTELTAHLPGVFWLGSVDRTSMFYVSPGYEKIFGSSRQSLLERPESWFARIHPEDRARVEDAVRSAASGSEYRQEYRVLRAQGDEVQVEERAFPIRDEMGNLKRFAGLVEDVTERRAEERERKKLEAELRQAQKLETLGALAAGIAHDFNNIITAILGNSELAHVRISADHPAHENIAQVIHASQRAVDLIRQILSFSRNQEHAREPVALAAVIVEVVKLLRGSLPANIGIRAALPERVPMVVANASQVHQVLMNLCSNAAHAMSEQGGSIEIHGEVVTVDGGSSDAPSELKAGRYVRVDVSDTGHGISAETLEHIFEPFFTTKRHGAGTGLGLAVVQGIMRDHHGAVVADSQLGRGTTMRLFFPVWTQGAELPPTRPLASGNGERLLVVGGGSSMVALALEALGTLGYQVRECASERAALELLSADPRAFDLVVYASAAAPFDLATQLRNLRSDVPIVVLCGAYDARELSNAPCEVLVKPFSLELLSQALRRALGASARAD